MNRPTALPDAPPSGGADTGFAWEPPLSGRQDLDDGPPRPDASPPARRSRINLLEHGYWSVICWIGGLAVGMGALSDNSFMTHLATGRLIRTSGAPHHDVFTFASQGQELVVQSWLASWIYATLEAGPGAWSIRLLVAGAAATIMMVLWRLSAPAESLIARVGLVSMAWLSGVGWWNERPQVLAYAVFSLVAWVMAERRSVWWLAPLFALWVNLHGSFPLGVVFVALMLVGRLVAQRRWSSDLHLAPLAVTLGAVLGAAVSPYGMDLLTFPLELLANQGSLVLLAEWRPLTLDTFANQVFTLNVVVVSALLVWRRSWMAMVSASIFCVLAFTSVRNVGVAGLTLVPLAAPSLAGLGSRDQVHQPSRRVRWSLVVASTMVVALHLATVPAFDRSAYPVRAVDWLESEGFVGGDAPADDASTAESEAHRPRILTHDYNGNYLAERFGTAARPWLDDRAEVHSFATLADYVGLLDERPNTSEILARNPHDLVMWSAAEPLADFVADSDDYEILYRDRGTVVACRTSSRWCRSDTKP